MLKLFILIAALLAATPSSPASPAPSRTTASPSPLPLTPEEVFSRRALRRARLLIQMRMLQLRDERLDCVREALRRQLPDALWPEVPSPARGSANAATAAEHCSKLFDNPGRSPA
ncbi:MAG: hypothetical protein JO146_02035 [Candidatus Eremiobacteraeota bacterium]|nr:hypothetical protein [Candidatus Eremiobacteraeota bacterium]